MPLPGYRSISPLKVDSPTQSVAKRNTDLDSAVIGQFHDESCESKMGRVHRSSAVGHRLTWLPNLPDHCTSNIRHVSPRIREQIRSGPHCVLACSPLPWTKPIQPDRASSSPSASGPRPNQERQSELPGRDGRTGNGRVRLWLL